MSNADKQFKRFNMLPLRNGNNRLPVGPCAEWRPTYHDGCENRFEQMQADADLSNMAWIELALITEQMCDAAGSLEENPSIHYEV